MEIVMKNPEELNAAEYNPREITEVELENLKQSITEFGIVEPIVINKDNTIIGGHQRVKALQELGKTEIPCYYVDLDKTKERLLNLALNKIQGRWEENKLSELIFQLKNEENVEKIVGFLDEEIEQYILRKEINNEIDEEYNPDDDEEMKKLFDRHERIPVTVNEPDAPRLKNKLSFYTETFEEYDKIRKFFETTRQGELNKNKLIEIITE